ncbi:uncharacterized protein [Vulpes vulpes]|uniref:Uncharacterized protein isoform X2 n=1 Tax=Vulpes vulpes TaxID=9627 RepID=A0ABM4ZFW8_VULVU
MTNCGSCDSQLQLSLPQASRARFRGRPPPKSSRGGTGSAKGAGGLQQVGASDSAERPQGPTREQDAPPSLPLQRGSLRRSAPAPGPAPRSPLPGRRPPHSGPRGVRPGAAGGARSRAAPPRWPRREARGGTRSQRGRGPPQHPRGRARTGRRLLSGRRCTEAGDPPQHPRGPEAEDLDFEDLNLHKKILHGKPKCDQRGKGDCGSCVFSKGQAKGAPDYPAPDLETPCSCLPPRRHNRPTPVLDR